MDEKPRMSHDSKPGGTPYYYTPTGSVEKGVRAFKSTGETFPKAFELSQNVIGKRYMNA